MCLVLGLEGDEEVEREKGELTSQLSVPGRVVSSIRRREYRFCCTRSFRGDHESSQAVFNFIEVSRRGFLELQSGNGLST